MSQNLCPSKNTKRSDTENLSAYESDDSVQFLNEQEYDTQPDKLVGQTICITPISLMPDSLLPCNQSEAYQTDDICGIKSKKEPVVPGQDIKYTVETSKKYKRAYDDAKDFVVYLSDQTQVKQPPKQPVLIRFNPLMPAGPSICNGSEALKTADTWICSTEREKKTIDPGYDAYENDYSKMLSNSFVQKYGCVDEEVENTDVLIEQEDQPGSQSKTALIKSNLLKSAAGLLIFNQSEALKTVDTNCGIKSITETVYPTYDDYACKSSKTVPNSIAQKSRQFAQPVLAESGTRRTRPYVVKIKRETVDSGYHINVDYSSTNESNTVIQKHCEPENSMKSSAIGQFSDVNDSSARNDTFLKSKDNGEFYPSVYDNSELLETGEIIKTCSTEIRTEPDDNEYCVYADEFFKTESNTVAQKQSGPENMMKNMSASQFTNIVDSSKETTFLTANNKKSYLNMCDVSDSLRDEDIIKTDCTSIEMKRVDVRYAAKHSETESNTVIQKQYISENDMQNLSTGLLKNKTDNSFMDGRLPKQNNNSDFYFRVYNKSESLKGENIVRTCFTEIETDTSVDHGHSVCVDELTKKDPNLTAQKICEPENPIKDQSSNQFTNAIDSIAKENAFLKPNVNKSYISKCNISDSLSAEEIITTCDINIKRDDPGYSIEHYESELCKAESNSVAQKQSELENAMKDLPSKKLANGTNPSATDGKCLVPSQLIKSVSNVETEQISNTIDKYLGLNMHFKHEDVKHCIKHITWKYIYDSKFQNDNLKKFSQLKRDNNRSISLIQNSKSSVTHQDSIVAQVTPSNMQLEETKNSKQDPSIFSKLRKRKSQELRENLEFPKKKQKEHFNKEKYNNVDGCKNQGYKNTAKKLQFKIRSQNSPSPVASCNSLSRSPNFRKLRITAEEYLRRNLISRDPRLRKKLVSDVKLSTDILRDDSKITRDLRSKIPNVRPSISIENDLSTDLATFPKQTYSRMMGPISDYLNKMRDKIETSYSIESQNLPFLIIEWNTSWLSMQKETEDYPPILGDFEIYETKTVYNDDYSITYYGLHLLSIWLSLYASWRNNSKMHQCDLVSCEEKRPHFKNTCQVILPSGDIPINQSIILVTFMKSHRQIQYFGYVYDVKTRPFGKYCRSYHDMKKVKFSFYTVEKIGVSKEKKITIQTLYRTRVAIKQYAALSLTLNSELKKVILNPVRYAHKIRAVHLPSDYSDSSYASEFLQARIDKIIETAVSQNNLFTLVQKPQGKETSTVIIKLIRYLMKGSTILICLKDMEKFQILANTLKDIKSIVLAVKESEVAIPEDLEPYTLRAHASKLSMNLEKAELEILKHSKFILTVTSSVFLSDDKTAVLGSNLTCIVDDAHLTTEAEIALLFSYNPKSIVLLGDATEHAALHASLQRLGYHKSLFHRFFRFAQGRYTHV